MDREQSRDALRQALSTVADGYLDLREVRGYSGNTFDSVVNVKAVASVSVDRDGDLRIEMIGSDSAYCFPSPSLQDAHDFVDTFLKSAAGFLSQAG